MTLSIETIGFVGLGAMGFPMVRRLLATGKYQVIVNDIAADRVDGLRAEGAKSMADVGAATLRELASQCDLVITMVPDSPDVEAAALGEDGIAAGLRPGAIYMDMSTIDPATTRRVGEAVSAASASMIDAPVGRTSAHAAEGTLLVMAGGEAETLEACRPILERFASDIIHCGPLGAGETMKLVNNLLTSTIVAADAEALALGAKAGIKTDVMLSVLRSTAASNTHLKATYANQALKGNLQPGFAVRLAAKDMNLALKLASDNGLPLTVAPGAAILLELARTGGHANDDYTSMLAVLEEKVGVEVRED